MITGIYNYYSASGELLYFKHRVEPGRNGAKKEFVFWHKKEDGSTCRGRGSESILYLLPDVIKARSVIITEGEKQADLLKTWGLCATSLDSGAGSRLIASMIDSLTGKRIAILQDNDEPGTQYALKLAKGLQGKYESLRIVLLPDLPDKGDICDWKGDKAQLLSIIKATPEWIPPPVEPKREIRQIKRDKKASVTDEMIEAAKMYPIDKLVELVHGKALAFCHEDKNPSLTFNPAKNKCRCHVCGKSFSTIDILVMRDGYKFIEAVRSLASGV